MPRLAVFRFTANGLRACNHTLMLVIGGFALLAMSSTSLAAQQAGAPISQEVVQQLPPPGVSRLNTALRRLANNSRDVDALIDAGEASLTVNDVDAAVGFFARAQDLAPNNPRVKAGSAATMVRKRRPIEALRLFDEAQAIGASTSLLAGDRALAYDLVGDNSTAMGFYRQALVQRENSATRRRFALSHAMAGDKRAFEAVLAPLLEKRDPASYRTRAFGLAILGEEDEAVAITEAVMPRDLAARIAPYLRYMPRLTKAQQAAAANLGVFPQAAQIGRDSPQIAQYVNRSTADGADARLAPQGRPLGRRDTRSSRRRPDRGASAVAGTQQDIVAKTPVQIASPKPAIAPTVAAKPVERPSATVPEKPAEKAPVQVAVQAPVQAAVQAPAPKPKEAVSVAAKPANMSGFDLAKVEDRAAAPEAPTANKPIEKPVAPPPSVADAFADFTTAPTATRTRQGSGVDISKIKPPREVAKRPEPKPEAKPKPPAHPKRYWVQIATGKDRNALKFDWRRISRKAPKVLGDFSPHVTPWGQSNRLLAGPFKTAKDARNAMNSLKESSIDSFTFTSSAGQEVDAL